MIDLKFLIAVAMVVAGLAFAALLRLVLEDRSDKKEVTSLKRPETNPGEPS